MSCPICRQPVPPDARFRPFCSKRCKLIDLSKWLGEEYRIPGPPAEGSPAEPGPEPDDSGPLLH